MSDAVERLAVLVGGAWLPTTISEGFGVSHTCVIEAWEAAKDLPVKAYGT